VYIGVGGVLELAAQEPAVLLGQFHGLLQHARAFLGRGRKHHLGAQETQQLAPLDAEAFRHGDDQRITLLRAHHGEADAGVATGGFDDGLAGLERAGFLRVLDDGAGHAVLDRTHGIEGFHLHVDVHALGRQAIEFDQRRVADGLQDVGETGHGDLLGTELKWADPAPPPWQPPWKFAWIFSHAGSNGRLPIWRLPGIPPDSV